jgi:hypothetical protein
MTYFSSSYMANEVSKIPSIYTDFKNVNCKNAPQKSFSQKNKFFGQNLILGALFNKGQMYIFEISTKRRIFIIS